MEGYTVLLKHNFLLTLSLRDLFWPQKFLERLQSVDFEWVRIPVKKLEQFSFTSKRF